LKIKTFFRRINCWFSCFAIDDPTMSLQMIRWENAVDNCSPTISQIIENKDVILKSWFYHFTIDVKKSKMATIAIYIFWLAKITNDWTGTLWCQSEIQDGQQSGIWFKICRIHK